LKKNYIFLLVLKYQIGGTMNGAKYNAKFRGWKKSILLLFFISFFISGNLSFGQHHGSDHSVGKTDFGVSSNSAVNAQFNYALAMLHHMMYDHAEKEFLKVIEQEPDCAMAYWGIAMSYFHPLWHDPTKYDLEKGWEAVKKAKELNAPTERERDYIAAIESVYKDWENVKHSDRLVNWVKAQEMLSKKYPDDIDAGAFYALSLLAAAPKNDKNFTNQKKAGALLEKLQLRAPEHPGLFHYIIHSYDNPELANRAVDVARAYDKLAPDVPHALHMPSHIFVRLGLWSDAVDWNIRSAASAKKHSLGQLTTMHYVHALDYLMYSYLQQGKDNLAKDVLFNVNEVQNHEDNLASSYGIAASQARYVLERRDWNAAANLPIRTHQKFPWDKYPWGEAITYFARGLGAARINNIALAKESIGKLDEFYNSTMEMGQNYWAVLVDAQRTTVAAWIAFSEGKKEEALQLMKKAADLEDSVDKHPVTPGAVLPARELLGDMLVLLEKPGDAISSYEASLKISPNRFNSLYGAGYAAELAGDLEKAKHYYSSLNTLSGESDGNRVELNKMKTFLAGN
jgi:tetratricopeptide (TPR) repeat protein